MSVGFDIQALLAAEGISADVNYVDVSGTTAVAIMETGGFEPIRYHGTSQHLQTIDRPTFQIIVRSEAKPAANSLIDAIVAVIDNRLNQTINGTYYLSVFMTAPPVYLGIVQTEQGETNEYSANFMAQNRR